MASDPVRLLDEVNKLTNPSLQRGVAETILDHGASDIVANLPFDEYRGQSYDFNIEKDLPDEDSAFDAYSGTSVASGVGDAHRISRDTGALARDADTPVAAERGKGDLIDQRARDAQSSAKKMAQDFVRHFFFGTGNSPTTLEGLEYWLQRYAGRRNPDNGQGREYDDASYPQFDDQKTFNTSDGDPASTQEALDTPTLRKFLNRAGDDRFTQLWVDEDTEVEIMTIAENMPGNMAGSVMDENLGREVFTFNGVPLIRTTALDEKKIGKNVTVDVDGASENSNATETIEVTESGDKKFRGFSDLDIQREFTLTDGTTSYEGTVIEILSKRKVEVSITSPPGSDLAEGDSYDIELDKTNVIYGTRFGTMDGITAYYHTNDGTPANPGDQYEGPIAGFNVTDMGRLEGTGRRYRYQLDWFGNFAVKSPYALARLSHFTLNHV